MSSHNTLNPNGGVPMGSSVDAFSILDDLDKELEKRGHRFARYADDFIFTTRLRPGNLCEPPGADPHAGWCGGWGANPPGYPIGPMLFPYFLPTTK
jgi:hypothetical protein